MSEHEPNRPTEHFVYVLDHDPGLRSALPEPDRARARQHAVAGVIELPTGDWDPDTEEGASAELGLLVLEGLVIRDVTVAEARCGELIGPGVLLRPQDARDTDAPMQHAVGWQIVEPTRMAMLDRRFLRVAAHWPSLITALVSRATERTNNLGVMVSIHSLKRVDTRLLAYFWHLADRFGKVTADGVLVPLALTHRQLALLVGAQRPSVTSALGALAERDLLRRDERGNWLLSTAASHPDEVALNGDDFVGAGDVRAPIA
ncbi:MAG TPA: Crp/Fnr family transcriptional regulator [Conexibacter sp.]|nr:Crp/Fnr family transcriptional regulator [Conexibacter sp.]